MLVSMPLMLGFVSNIFTSCVCHQSSPANFLLKGEKQRTMCKLARTRFKKKLYIFVIVSCKWGHSLMKSALLSATIAVKHPHALDGSCCVCGVLACSRNFSYTYTIV